jgi:hypothetical protein
MRIRIAFRGLQILAASIALSGVPCAAVAKAHVITFGKWTSVQCFTGNDGDKAVPVKVRSLSVDGKVKEFILGTPHEVTERLFVAQRAFRMNGSLPGEAGAPHWQWQRGGWVLVDRLTGRISAINLPEFDAAFSMANWFRDYAAYCGVSEDGKKSYAMVAQLGRRKPVVKNALPAEITGNDQADCPAPSWQRDPVRVGFQAGGAKQTFAIRGRIVDLVSNAEEEEEGSK